MDGWVGGRVLQNKNVGWAAPHCGCHSPMLTMPCCLKLMHALLSTISDTCHTSRLTLMLAYALPSCVRAPSPPLRMHPSCPHAYYTLMHILPSSIPVHPPRL